MKGHGSKFSHKMEQAVVALLTQRNIEEAARSVGISGPTLLRWQKLPEFQTAYREARRAAYGQAVSRLHQASGAAVSTLLKVMVESGTPASARIRAAECVLDHTKQAIELEDVEARVAALEQAAEIKKPGWRQ